MSLTVPTPIAAPALPVPNPSDLATWAARMAEMHRWMREDAAPGMTSQSEAAYQNALEAALMATTAQSAANYSGVWATLTGPIVAGRSVFHASKFWVSLQAIADVTTITPGTDSTRWWPLDVNATVVGYNATTVAAALAAIEAMLADEVTLKDSASGAVMLAAGTTAQRPASPTAGMARFNTDYGMFEGWDGAAWKLLNRKLLPRWATTSGSSFGWSSIPAEATCLTLAFDDMSFSGSNGCLIRLNGLVTGYSAFAHLITSGGSSSTSGVVTNGVPIMPNSSSSAFTGAITLVLDDPATNLWVVSGELTTKGGSMRTHGYIALGSGVPITEVALDRVSSDTFDGGGTQLTVEG